MPTPISANANSKWGRWREYISLVEQAIRLSPRNPLIGVWFGRIGPVHLLQSRINEATLWLEKARTASPGLPYIHSRLASAHALNGETARAAAELAEARRLSGDHYYASIAHLSAEYLGVPKIRALYEDVYFANLVLDGAGSAEDRGRVAHWFEQAAASGDLVAAFNFGLCLDKGVGSEPDVQQAAHWLRRAAEGVPEAQYVYGRLLADGRGVTPDLEAARGWIARAAAAGLRDAQVALAEMLVNGRGGPRDTAAALDLFENAAGEGHSGAMFALGALYAGGHDLPEDRTAAQRWFRAAAELGHGQAQLMLGRYLAEGAAGEPNPSEARSWFEQAAAQGIEEAQADLAALPGVTLQ
jgi:TPR repeat protein